MNKNVCIIGAGPCGMSALFQFANFSPMPQVICFEKSGQIGGLWNYTWLTGTDEYGEPCHGGMYRHLWSNGPKECLEYPDYTFEKHFGQQIPSFPPRPVLRDYLEGRFKSCKVDLTQFIRFHTVVRNVNYIADKDVFMVTYFDLKSNTTSTEMFSHVIVAVGVFNCPNKPYFPGIEDFSGQVLHSHDFRAAEDFKGQRLLIVGASYSAEDIAMQTMKYGAKSVICTWRTKPMGFRFPYGIEERPMLQGFKGNTAYFKDGTCAEIDSIILCTGYRYHFPFLEDSLRLTSKLTLYTENTYKSTLFLGGGNNKLFYLGIQDQYFTFTMFDVQALWTCKYIMGTLKDEPKTMEQMQEDVKKWLSRQQGLKDCHDDIDFQADYMADLCQSTGYTSVAAKSRDMFHNWEHHRRADIATYRDQCFTSLFTGTKAPTPNVTWLKAFDDRIAAFVRR